MWFGSILIQKLFIQKIEKTIFQYFWFVLRLKLVGYWWGKFNWATFCLNSLTYPPTNNTTEWCFPTVWDSGHPCLVKEQLRRTTCQHCYNLLHNWHHPYNFFSAPIWEALVWGYLSNYHSSLFRDSAHLYCFSSTFL